MASFRHANAFLAKVKWELCSDYSRQAANALAPCAEAAAVSSDVRAPDTMRSFVRLFTAAAQSYNNLN